MFIAGVVATFTWSATPARAGELLVTNFFGDSVTRYDLPSGSPLAPLQGGVGLDGALCTRIGPDGLLYVASEASNTVQRYNLQTGAFIDNFVTPGNGLGGPSGLTWGPDGDLFVSSFNNDRVLRYDGATGVFESTFVGTGLGTLDGPDNGTIFGPDGNLYVPSYNNNKILRYDGSTGAFIDEFVAQIGRPRVLIFRGDDLLVTTERGDAVRRYDADTGSLLGNFVAQGSGGLDAPVGMAFGDDGFMYVSSATSNSVLRYDATSGAFVDTLASNLGGPVFLTYVPEPTSATLFIMLVMTRCLNLARR
ncbi:MAG: hypothetical protein ACKVS9_09495 [Phycisphaerae bacterium]